MTAFEPKLDDDCIFCKIIKGDIPSYTVYEDDVADIFGYDRDLASIVFARIPEIARAIKATDENIIGMNIVNNNGAVAYQSVFHSHFHLIPRYSDKDDFRMIFKDNAKKYDETDYTRLQNAIKTELAN